MGWGTPQGCRCRGVPGSTPVPRALLQEQPDTGRVWAAHLLTLVVTDGKFIEDEVPALPALPLENRRGNPWVLGPALSPCQGHAGGIRSTPEPGKAAAQHSPRGPPALTTLPCFTQ